MAEDISPKKTSQTILVVDDDRAILSTLTNILEHDGYTVFKAFSAEEGLRIIKENPISVAIVDQIMPGMKGTELLKIIKKDYPDTIRILISGYADFLMAQKAIVNGEVYRFLIKPWQIEELRLNVRQAMEYHCLRQENLRLVHQLRHWNEKLKYEVEKKTKELKNSEEKYRNLFEKAPEGIVLIDSGAGCKIVDFNKAFQKMTGYKRSELKGLTFWEIQDKSSWNGDEERFQKKIQKEKRHFLKLQFFRKDSQKIYVDFFSSWVRFKHTRLLQGFCIDVTERVELDRDLMRANKLAEERSEELEEFVNITTHEIRSHLVPTIGYAKMLREDYKDVLDPKALKWLEEMKKSGQTVKELIAAIMNISKIKTQVDEFEMIDTKRILEEVTALMAGRLNQQGIRLIVDEQLPPIFGDQLKIKILFQNLIENAVKYMGEVDPEPTIEIGFAEGDGFYEFFIKDTGIGISEENSRNVFKPLWAVSKKKATSTGMGLYYVKKIMELHGGDIRVEPRKDKKGSVFYFHFPKVILS